MRSYCILISLLTFSLLMVPSYGEATANSEKSFVWTALLKAQNSDEGVKEYPELAPFLKSLKKTFGYSHFKVIAEDERRLPAMKESWLIPSKEIYLKLMPMVSSGESTELYGELYKGKKLLVQFEVEAVPGKPLFIRGPQWGTCQLVIVLLVK